MTVRYMGLILAVVLVLMSAPASADGACDDIATLVEGWTDVSHFIRDFDLGVSDAEHEALVQALGPMYRSTRALAVELTTRRDPALVELGHRMLDGFNAMRHAPNGERASGALDEVVGALQALELMCREEISGL